MNSRRILFGLCIIGAVVAWGVGVYALMCGEIVGITTLGSGGICLMAGFMMRQTCKETGSWYR